MEEAEEEPEEPAEDLGDTYILTMTVSEAYLSDPQRQYPVTIDPSAEWKGNDKLRDVYVISGSSYKNKNYYKSGTIVMPAGKGDYGTYRTYIKFYDLASVVKGKSISSATLSIYGAGQKSARTGQKVSVKEVTSSWDCSKIKWTNQPSFSSSALDTVTAAKTKNKKYNLNVRSYVQGIADGKTGYGLVLVNTTSTPKYTSFFGSRKSGSYKPRLKVTYYNVPSEPTEAGFTESTSRTGRNVELAYKGISSDGLAEVDYRLEKKNDEGSWSEYKAAAKAGDLGEGSVIIPEELPEGEYRAAVWGINKAEAKGKEKLTDEVIVDKTAPDAADIKISTKDKGDISAGWTEDTDPLITVTGIKDNRPLEKGNLSYAMTGKGEEAQYKACRVEAFTEQSGTYTAKIRLGEEDKNLPSGSYEIRHHPDFA